MSPDQDIVSRFQERYSRPLTEAALAVEREAIGANVGANGYTTVAQADVLADQLALRPATRLLDIGAGRGWPGLYLAKTSGCEVVLSDVPEPGLRTALSRARRQRLDARCPIVRATGALLPFRSRTFDAVVHTDTL